MGTHPHGPSYVRQADGRDVSLVDVIDANPEHVLGRRCLERFGPRLPFLLKVLAVDQAMSVKVHPAEASARAAHAEETRRRIPRNSGARRVGDPYGKPAQLLALTAVQILAGLRTPRRARRLLELLAVPELLPVALLAGTRPDKALLELGTLRPRLDHDFAQRCTWAATSALSDAEIQRDPDFWNAMCWVIRLAAQHPGDPFVIAPLLLQLHDVAPGESLSVPPGTVHTCLQGLAVEISAASDNVARAGLTSKEVDLDLVEQWLDPCAQAAPSQHTRVTPALRTWSGDGAPYRLSSLTVEEPLTADRDADVSALLPRTQTPAPMTSGVGRLPVHSWNPGGVPAVVCCVRGQVILSAQGEELMLAQGQSAFVGADVDGLALYGGGEVVVATPDPDAPQTAAPA